MSDRLWEKQAPARIHKPASKPETVADSPAPAPVKKAAKKTKKS